MNNPSAIIHGEQRAILGADLTDAQVASSVFMCSSGVDPLQLLNSAKKSQDEQLNLAYQMAMPHIGRDRILHLSQRLELAEMLLKRAAAHEQVEFGKLGEEIRNFLSKATTKPSVEPNVMLRK